MNSSSAPSFVIVILAFFAVTFVAGLFWFRRYTMLTADKGFLALLGSVIAAGAQVFSMARRLPNSAWQRNEVPTVLSLFAAGICVVFCVAFVLRLWGKWVGGKVTPEEAQPGQPGVRAWFSAANVVVGLGIVIGAWVGFDISPLLSALLVVGALAAYPLLRIESPPVPATIASVPFERSSAEREKIVAMLEAGKITADECAELLQALGETARPEAPRAPLTGSQRLFLIGAALVVLGFFLPWIVINPGKEAGRVMSQFGVQFGLEMPVGEMSFPDANIKTPTVSYAGGDIKRGLGWAALGFALAAALIPYIATTLDPATSRTVRLLCLGIGGIIIAYLLTQNLRFVGIGLIIAVTGYALEIAAAWRERRTITA